MSIPFDPMDYSVNLSTGTIHTRHAGDHAGDVRRTRTQKGATTLLDGKEPRACGVCYVSPRYAASFSSKPQQRRSGPVDAEPGDEPRP